MHYSSTLSMLPSHSDFQTTPTRTMPFSRKKSCMRCRTSKSGCDRSLPSCSRCARRHLQCVYDARDSDFVAPYPRPRPAISVPNEGKDFEDTVSIDVDVEVGASRNHNINFSLLDSAIENDLSWPFSISQSESSSHAFNSTKIDSIRPLLTPTFTQIDLEKPDQLFSMTGSQSIANSGFSLTTGSSITTPPSPGLCGDHGDSRLIPLGHDSTRSCLKRRQILTDCVLSVVVMGQLTSFPKMMIKGDRLPPFIKPPCHSDEELVPKCAIHGSHQCLPKILAICAGLVEMFYSRTAGNAGYVWNLIYGEANRLRKETHALDAKGRLEAVQSVTVFLLLQADDPKTVETNDVASLLMTGVNMLFNLLSHSDWRSESSKTRPIQSEWVFRESLRRLMSIYGVIDLMLDGIGRLENGDIYDCGALTSVPLPCIRDIWEATTVRNWIREYDEYLATRDGDTMLTTRSLMETRLVAPFISASDEDPNNDIIRWCKGMDGLGSIIWMITPLHKYRLREDVRGIW